MPQQTSINPRDGTPSVERLAGLRVLVTDDSVTVRRSTENLLTQWGCQFISAADGLEALSKVMEHRPDLILLDVMMPRLNGYATCSLLKSNPRYRAIPVIMLSGNDGIFDRARGRLSGADDYLVKPFDRESLLQALATISLFTQEPTPE